MLRAIGAGKQNFGSSLKLSSALLSLTVGLAAPGVAQAQVLPRPPAPTREEVTRPDVQQVQPPASQLTVEGGIERAPCALDNPEYANIRFTLRDVQFDGLKEVSPETLRGSYSSLVGQEHPVSVICEIRDRAATMLRQAGYIAAVEVPEQRIAEGTVQFKVLMAKLVEVRVRGDAGGAERVIAGYLNKLTEQPVFNREDAERYLLLASDLPGYNVRLTLRPAGTAPGEVIGDVAVVRMRAFVDTNIQNLGSRELGRWGGLVRGQLYGLTGLGDRTTASFFTTADLDEQQTLQVGHDFRLGPQGLTLSGNFTYAWARPDTDDEGDIDARTLFATVEAGYPFVRRQSHTLRGSLGMDIINQDVELDDIDLTRDRLRVLFARLNGEAQSMDFSRAGSSILEPVWRVNGTLELRRGLDIFGATDHCGSILQCLDGDHAPPSRIEADGSATVIRGSVYGEFRPISKVTFALGVRGQYADDPLLSFEEFSAGNYTVGRGYDPGTLLGDRGLGVQAEIRYGSLIATSAKKLAAEGYAFVDHAEISNKDNLFVVDQPNNLTSVGGGIRANYDRFHIDAAVAFPLERAGLLTHKPDPRFLLSLTTRFLPWSY